ncbi:hypothetical protein DSCO28_71430 [Desulfosarcina ovata subsp. sediminis]|uniref:AMP-binding enzyme C-terminal domain-containing protein n=1 Tax=Desulfosarcina ovata subsp. sediminis TaxID=885957 RepID=A0A5K8A258_9BACT|nr:hypothetical protein DSCO28_71430 [Desulfosarcina ovata subsp. sediminis]
MHFHETERGVVNDFILHDFCGHQAVELRARINMIYLIDIHSILSEVHEFLSGKMARYKIPKSIVIMNELPTTVWGKIKKVELKRKHRERYQSVDHT